jgi:hypothetical protein
MHTQSKFLIKIFRGLIVVSLVLTANASNASSFFQQGVIEPIDGIQADNPGGFINGDDFNVASPTNLESISWWGAYFGPNPNDPDTIQLVTVPTDYVDQFSVKIFNSLSATPDSVDDLIGTLERSVTGSNSDYYLYKLTLSSSLPLLTGNHFLSIHNTGYSAPDTYDYAWFWLSGNASNDVTISTPLPGNSSWDPVSGPLDGMAFSLEGSRIQTIPEPNTLILLLLGCSMLIIANKAMKNTYQA